MSVSEGLVVVVWGNDWFGGWRCVSGVMKGPYRGVALLSQHQSTKACIDTRTGLDTPAQARNAHVETPRTRV